MNLQNYGSLRDFSNISIFLLALIYRRPAACKEDFVLLYRSAWTFWEGPILSEEIQAA